MNNRVNFNEIYEDFFGKNSNLVLNNNEEKESNLLITDYNNKIDNMFLSNESKELLKKIINYYIIIPSRYTISNSQIKFFIIISLSINNIAR